MSAPPTATPEKGQGPWCDENLRTWWVVTDSAGAALNAVDGCEALPDFFGWQVTVAPCLITWTPAEEFCDEHEVCEVLDSETDGAVQAWRIIVEGV